MRCCWLLAMSLAISPLGMQFAAAEEPFANELRKANSSTIRRGDEVQATLAALSADVRVPPRRHSAKPAVAESGLPAPIVRMAKPSPYAVAPARDDPTSQDGMATRLVSHHETGSTLTEIPAEELPETSRSAVWPATVWTPTEVGDVEEETPAPAATPIAVTAKAELQSMQSRLQFERPEVQDKEPTDRPDPSAVGRAEPSATLTLKPTVAGEKRESSRAGGGYSNNPLRQVPNSAIIRRGPDNPLR